MATVQLVGWAARSARSQVACADVAPQPPILEQLLLSMTACQAPISKL